MQTYIARGGELVCQPPFVSEEVEYYGFILDADKKKLQDLCDRYLNSAIGSAGRFVPAAGFVLLACCKLPSLRSISPPHSNFGRFVEHEVALWMLVIDKAKKRLYWMLPYIFVDNTFAMAMGRELYGFPKSILKQIRDVVQPLKAACQAIVETTAFSSRVHEGRILGANYDVIIEQCDSHPICADFGMPATGLLRSKINFYVNFDFQIGLGTIIPPKA